jgi:dynein heavy chain 1
MAQTSERARDFKKLLKRQRYAFHGDWMESSVIIGLLQQVEQLLGKRTKTMEGQMPLLQSRIMAEDKANIQRVADLVAHWKQNEPLMGNIAPQQALDALAKFEFGMKKAQVDQENLIKAKDALNLDLGEINNAISGCLVEVSELSEVWQAISKPCDALDAFKDTLFATANIRAVRKTLDDLLIEMRLLPNRIRQYDAYT